MREASGMILLGHDARRALGDGSKNAGRDEKDHRRQKEARAGDDDRIGKGKDVFAALECASRRDRR